MSGEVLHPTQEATANSNGVSNDLHNSEEPAAAGKTDPSAASPVASTFLNSASTTAQTSPVQGAPGVSGNSEQLSSDTALEQPIAAPDSALGSDTVNQSSSPTSLTAAQVGGDPSAGQEDSSKRGSRGSIKAPSRKGSTASSKLSNKERTAVPAASSQEKAAENQPFDNLERPKKKGLSRLFSILNCCSSSKDAHASESNQAIPPKKAKTLQPNRGRQPTPMTKPNASAGESSKTESKEAIEDNIAGPPYSELTPAAKPKIIEPPKKEVPMTEKPPIASVLSAEPKVMTAQPTSSDQPLSPLPPNSEARAATTYGPFDEKAAAINTDGLAEPTVSPSVPAAETGVSKEEMTINDRTPQQEARDIEMPDAPPVLPVPEKPAAHQESTVQNPSHTNLPPPPPLTPSGPLSTDREGSNGATMTEQQKWLLPPMTDRFRGKKCLVLDLDETLVHSSFKILHQADFTIPVEIEGQYHNVYVIKRPGVDQFMKRVGELYEVVVFTASVSKYGDPLLDQLDIHNVVHHRLFRESCYNHQGNYVKDLSQVGRDLRETIIIDNSPTSYVFHPQHAVPISSWFSDAHDNELLDLIPVLEDLAGPQVRDVSLVLDVGL
ncbi:MAG: hypothetical protein LQ343_006594 [Gyalolechia ehrenbergii]|nr:MAG: hypothetical protein LQ343_006594 [Gyalolechia ehrenbergii]